MLKRLEKGILELIQVHREHLEIWRSWEKELEKLEAAYKNHSDQRELFIKVDISNTELGTMFPDTKEKLISKLEIKISDLDSRLRDKLEIMETQKNTVLRLAAECAQAAEGVEFSEMMEIKNIQLETGFLVEFCFDLEQTYLNTINHMLSFLSINKRMEWLFGRKLTPDEMLRKNQRALTKAMRELDRERAKMEQQEKKIIADIKKMAKQGQMDSVKIMAKDLVRTRRYVKKFMLMKANIQAVSLKIQTLKSQNAMAQAMKGVTRAMMSMNRQMKLPEIQKIMQEFEKQSEIMDMKEEMMNDVIDDAMGDDDEEEESDAIVTQVLDELGLQLTDQLTAVPIAGGSIAAPGVKGKTAVPAGAEVDADADLQARLDNLRRE